MFRILSSSAFKNFQYNADMMLCKTGSYILLGATRRTSTMKAPDNIPHKPDTHL